MKKIKGLKILVISLISISFIDILSRLTYYCYLLTPTANFNINDNIYKEIIGEPKMYIYLVIVFVIVYNVYLILIKKNGEK